MKVNVRCCGFGDEGLLLKMEKEILLNKINIVVSGCLVII